MRGRGLFVAGRGNSISNLSFGKYQADDKPTDDKPTDDKPKDDKPKDDKPTDDKPKDDKPTDDKPKDDKPKDDKPTDDKPTDDKPKDDKPTDDKPKDDKPTDDKPKEDKKDDKKDDKSRPQHPTPRRTIAMLMREFQRVHQIGFRSGLRQGSSMNFHRNVRWNQPRGFSVRSNFSSNFGGRYEMRGEEMRGEDRHRGFRSNFRAKPRPEMGNRDGMQPTRNRFVSPFQSLNRLLSGRGFSSLFGRLFGRRR
jgi:hypothetical protein